MTMGYRIIGTGAALPERIVSNAEMCGCVDTSEEWIESRTGIRERRFCGPEEDAFLLAERAARAALTDAGISGEEVGCCLAATMTAPTLVPGVACRVHRALGLPEGIPSLDVNGACTGFLLSASAAAGFLTLSGGRYALLVGCEQLSAVTDMTDRSTCVLFGDGAGALVLEWDPALPEAWDFGTRGSDALHLSAGGKLQMEGREVFRFAVETVPACAQRVLERAGLSVDQVDYLVCHQANARIIAQCAKRLGIGSDRAYMNLQELGNTSAASIPLAIHGMAENGLLKPGSRLLCVGFGGGLSWCGTLLTWKGAKGHAAE